jgi:hypothetical protein
MVESLFRKMWAALIVQAPKLRRQIQIFPPGLWIAAIVIAMVGGRYLWIRSTVPVHLQEIAAAYGSVGLFYGLPQTDHAGNHLTFVETSDKGYAVFLADAATGHKMNVREGTLSGGSHDQCDLHVWPWSPDDRFFICSAAGQISICDPETGKSVAELNTPTYVTDLTWLNPAAFACVEADGGLYQFERPTDGKWRRKEPAHSQDGFTLRSMGGTPAASAGVGADIHNAFDPDAAGGWSSGDAVAPVWLQYQFYGPAWAITQYKLTSSANDAKTDPRNWELLGSDDGVKWAVLDARTNQAFSSRMQTKQYDISNETPYWFYRLDIKAAAGGAGVRLARFQLWSADSSSAVSASAENAPNYSAPGAFDGSVNTKWWNDNAAPYGWLQYQFGGGAAWAVSQYAITSGDNGPRRDPKVWQFQASNDGNNWIDLDARNGETFTDRLQTKSYSFANSTPYRFYRLNIEANNGGRGEGVQLSELDLKSTFTDLSGSAQTISVARNPLAGAFSLTALSGDTIAYGQGNRIWSMNLASNAPDLIVDAQASGPGNIILRSFSCSQKKGQFLLNCSQDGKDTLWQYDTAASSKLYPIKTPVPAHAAVWLNGSNQDGWVGAGNRYLLLRSDSASDPVRLLPGANIDAFTLTSDGQRLFLFGTTSNEPSAGIWQYDLAAAKLRCVVPYADHPSSYASRRNHTSGTVHLPSGGDLNYDIFQPAHFNRRVNHKFPLVIGDTYFGNVVNGAHGRLWVPALAAGDAYVVIVNRRDWAAGIDQWGDDVMAAYRQLLDNPNIDQNRVFLFGVSAETQYLSKFVAEFPGLWTGVILLNPTGLPDFSQSPPFQPRPRMLLSAGGEEGEENRFKRFQADALKSGVLVDYIIHPGEGHHLVGNAAQLGRTTAMMRFISEE